MSNRFNIALERLSGIILFLKEDGSRDYIDIHSHELEVYKECRSFLFTPSNKEVSLATDYYAKGEVLDLPFECCWFEILGKTMTTAAASNKASIDGIFVSEKFPGGYAVTFLSRQGGETELVHVENSAMKKYLLGLVKYLLTRISKEKTAIQKVATKVRAKDSKGKKYKYRPCKTIVVSESKNYSSQQIGFEVDWNYQWQVRGHWRKLSDSQKLGRDRTSNVITSGYTWIKPYFKGSSDKPLLVKERVVVSGQGKIY